MRDLVRQALGDLDQERMTEIRAQQAADYEDRIAALSRGLYWASKAIERALEVCTAAITAAGAEGPHDP